MEADNPNDKILAASLDKLGNNHLRSMNFEVRSISQVPSEQFFSNCFTYLRHLQSLGLWGLIIPKVPKWMAHADRLVYLNQLEVKELRSDDIQTVALPHLPQVKS